MINDNIKKCKKCGQPLIKSKNIDYSLFCLDDYTGTNELCMGCNATESVINRLKKGKNISLEELMKLPDYLIFDPNNNDMQELGYGIRFSYIVNSYMSQYNCAT